MLVKPACASSVVAEGFEPQLFLLLLFLRDELTSAQKHLLQNLVDSTGTPLDPSQWRIQTTSEGELILMRIDVNGGIHNRDNEDGKNDGHERTGYQANLS